MKKNSFFKNHGSSLILVASMVIGASLGIALKERSRLFKPLGDIFLNLLFTAVVPVVFFSISSAVSSMKDPRKLKNILLCMLGIFLVTGIAASLLMAGAVTIFPPAKGMTIDLGTRAAVADAGDIAEKIACSIAVPDFVHILSKSNMLALILFSLLVGLAAAASGEKGGPFRELLSSGNIVMARVISYIMLLAPAGLGAYFAYLAGLLGPDIIRTYFRVMAIYYPVSIAYFFMAFSFYVYLSGGLACVSIFWRNVLVPSLTAWATGSSIAAIPANLEAAKNIGVPEDIREVVIPIGATIHMDGSCLAAVLKIALLFGLFGMDFSGPLVIMTAVAAAILCGVVMSGIPGGGFLGEVLIVTLYGFPPEALPVISMVGTIVDPPATMINSVGDTAASMLIARVTGGRKWAWRG